MSGLKYDEGKNRLDLIPIDSLWEVGKVYTMGGKKYNDWNWTKGIKYSRLISALLRHLFKWVSGEKFDLEDGQHHLASVVWCGLGLIHYDLNSEEYRDFDDRRDGWYRDWVQKESKQNPQIVKNSIDIKKLSDTELQALVPYTPMVEQKCFEWIEV